MSRIARIKLAKVKYVLRSVHKGNIKHTMELNGFVKIVTHSRFVKLNTS